VPDLVTCDAPSPCPDVTEQIGELVRPPTDAALRCVIDALRARTPGRYVRRLTVASSGTALPSVTVTVYLVKADGAVHRINSSSRGASDPNVCALPPASSFDACLESVSTDTGATPECRNAVWAIDCAPDTVSCD
jgi:hypothetical protein